MAAGIRTSPWNLRFLSDSPHSTPAPSVRAERRGLNRPFHLFCLLLSFAPSRPRPALLTRPHRVGARCPYIPVTLEACSCIEHSSAQRPYPPSVYHSRPSHRNGGSIHVLTAKPIDFQVRCCGVAIRDWTLISGSCQAEDAAKTKTGHCGELPRIAPNRLPPSTRLWLPQ